MRYFNPAYFMIENPVGMLKDSTMMQELEGFKLETSYCRYGTPYQKNTNIWTNVPLEHPLKLCRITTPCKSLIHNPVTHRDNHLSTSQSGPSRNGTLGSGSGKNVYPIPVALVLALFRPALNDLSTRKYLDYEQMFY